MASVGLGLAGGAIFGPPGAIVGSFLGGLVDNYLLFPAIFGKKSAPRRLDDINLQVASEGSDVNWCVGPRNRVAGTVIWQSEVYFEQKTTRVGKGVGGQSVTQDLAFVDLSVSVAQLDFLDSTKVFIRKVWADSKVIYDYGTESNDSYDAINFYTGTVVDPLIESYEGAGNVPLMKGRLRATFTKLAIHAYGTRTPNLEFLVEAENDVTLGEAISKIMQRGGYDVSEFDVTQLTQCFRGLVVSGAPSTGDVLRSVMLAYGVTAQEHSGKIYFIERGRETKVTVDEIAVAQEDADRSRPVYRTDPSRERLPRAATVRFRDDDSDLQQGAQTYESQNANAEDAIVADLPITLTATEGAAVAARLIHAAHLERREVKVSVRTRDIAIVPGDVVVTSEGEFYVQQVTRLFDSVVELSCLEYVPEAWTQEFKGEIPGAPSAAGYELPTVEFRVFNAPPLLSGLADDPGLYVAATGVGDWRGAVLFSSTGGDYSEEVNIRTRCTMGRVTEPPGIGPTWTWDRTNHIEVELTHGTLNSVTEDECVRGANRAAIEHTSGEWEIIGFSTVTALGNGLYRLENLLRGLHGTEHLISGHRGGDFVLMNTNLRFITKSPGDTRNYKVVPVGGLLDDYDPISVQCEGVNVRSLSPSHLEGDFNSSNDLTLTWNRRTRVPKSAFSNGPLSTNEIPETYEIEFRAGRNLATIIRTQTVAGTTTFTYTASQRTTDGFSSSTEPVHAVVYQVNQSVGRSIGVEGIFPKPAP